jgi:fructose-1,6-bisphosphatase/inositol monophosphatase family enzyme
MCNIDDKLIVDERKQSDFASPLNGECESALMLCAGSGFAARFDLAALGGVAFQLCHVFKVDIDGFVDAEATDFAAGSSIFVLSSAARGAGFAMIVISSHTNFLK